MTVNTAQGSKLFIGGNGAQPVDNAAWAALTWVEVGEVENFGEIGDESRVGNFTAVADARTRKLKGPFDAGTLNIVVGKDPNNAGQTAMKAAKDSKFDYNFKIQLADAVTPSTGTPTLIYFRGIVQSNRDNIGAVDNVVRTTYSIGVNIKPIEVPAT